jgi:hypothetical protein
MARRVFILAAGAVLSVLSACGESRRADPYPAVTLRRVTRGEPVASEGFRYKLVRPNIEVLHRNLGLVREGNLVEFIAGRNLEERLGEAPGREFDLAVVKEFSPFVHFRVEKLYTATDTTFLTPGPVALPRVTDAAAFPVDAYERMNVDEILYNRTEALRGLQDKRLRIVASITEEQGSGGRFFLLHGANARLRVAAATEGTGLILKLLAEKGYPFEGGVRMTELEDQESRMDTKIAGTVEVEYVKYGRRIVSG